MIVSKLFTPFFFISIVLIVIIISTFRQLPLTFYQQDEWLGSGQVISAGYSIVTRDLSPIQLLTADGRPLARLLGVFFLNTFKFDTAPLALYSIFFHILNSLLVLLISQKLFKKIFPAFIAGAFFALNSVSHQGVTWFAASFGLQPAVFFILLSIYLMVISVERKKISLRILAFLSAFFSLYFKEIGVFLFIFLPLLPVILDKEYKIKKDYKFYLPFGIIIAVLSLYRLIQMFFVGGPGNANVYVTAETSNLLLTIFIRIIMYPLVSFSLIFIPYQVAKEIAVALTYGYYPYIPQNISRWDLISYTSILDNFAIIFSFLLIIILAFIYKKRTDLRTIIIFGVLFYLLSLAPYVIISKDFSYLEPRYYYLTSAASGLILAVFMQSVLSAFNNKKLLLGAMLIIFLGYIRYQILIIRTDIAQQVDIANERRAFLKDLNNYLPTLVENTNVFYFSGSKSFLVDNNMLPFQHGFGHSVMSLYYDSGKIPSKLPESEYLFRLGEQGYKSDGRVSFGYYSNLEELKKSVKDNKISSENIYAFYYDWDNKKLNDITDQVRQDVLK